MNRHGMLWSMVFAALLGASAARAAPGAFGFATNFSKVGDGEGGTPTYGSGYHNVVVDGQNVYAAYGRINSGYGQNEVLVGVSDNGGLKWNTSVIVAHAASIDAHGAAIAIGPDPASPGAKVLHVLWGDSDGIWYAHSPASPLLAFSSPVLVSGAVAATAWARSVAADASGGVHVAFLGGATIYYSRSADGGATFVEVATPVVVGAYQPEIVADVTGNLVVAWGTSDVYVVRKPAGGTWGAPLHANGAKPGNAYPSLAMQDFQHLYLAWSNGGSGEIYVALSSDGGTSWSQVLALAGSYTDASLAVDGSGNLSIAAGASTYGSIFVSTSSNGTRWSAPTQVLTDTSTYFPNLVLDSAGKALIMYESSGAVRFTRQP